MSKVTRATQKVFGSTAGLDQIGQFGSLAAGSAAFATTPAQVQALANYLTGWFGAVIGGDSPALEDRNALDYLFSYQLAYVMQAGIPEYDAGTTYYKGSFASDGLGGIYYSATDANVGNALSSATNWYLKGGIVPIGGVVATFPNLTGAYTTTATTAADQAGWVKCNGQTIVDATSPMNGQVVPNVNNAVFLQGATTSGTSGGSTTHTHNMAHSHVWSYNNGAGAGAAFYSLATADNSRTAITTTDTPYQNGWLLTASGSADYFQKANSSFPGGVFYTTGVASNVNTGTGSSAQTGGASVSVVPPYITAVYVMRIR